MIHLLRLFPQFRALQDAVDRADLDMRRAQAEADLWRIRADAAEARVRELTDRMLDDRARLADTMSLHAIGKRVYSKAEPPPPQDAAQHPVIPGRVFARAAQQQQTAQFYANLRKQMGVAATSQPETPAS